MPKVMRLRRAAISAAAFAGADHAAVQENWQDAKVCPLYLARDPSLSLG